MFQEPKRWDVVVFKSPHDPQRFDYAQNYIKRLIGKPGESIMILDGDIYVGKGEDVTTYKVQTKPRRVQDALWRTVYDNDFHPRGLKRDGSDSDLQAYRREPEWVQPWQSLPGQTGWNFQADTNPREFIFSNMNGGASVQFNAAANPTKYALTDWLAYDVTEGQPDNTASDVKLEFIYERQQGSGPLLMQLEKNRHSFEAKITPDDVTLLMDGAPVDGPKPLPRKSGPIHLAMSNVDYCVSLVVDGEELLSTRPEQYVPDIADLLENFRTDRDKPKANVRIIAEQQVSAFRHIKLSRDVYYLNRGKHEAVLWGGPPGSRNGPIHLKEDEFFVMGDNSSVSLDARYWSTPISLPHEDLFVASGRVPRRFMLGKAFFVYWPAGYKPFDRSPAIVPDFGDMRFIH